MDLRWFPVVLILVLALVACEPDYITSSALTPVTGQLAIQQASTKIDALVNTNDANVADFESRLDSSEEQLAFDVTSAKRQLVGKTDSKRADVSDMVDVHEHNALTEIDRARSRVHTLDSDVHAAAAEQLGKLAQLDPSTADQTDTQPIVAVVQDAMNTTDVESVVSKAQDTAVSASDRIQTELNRVRDLKGTSLSSTTTLNAPTTG